MNINTNRIFNEREYKELLIEYHNFISFILHDINRYTIYSSSVKFIEDSVIYKNKEQFIIMLKDAFPTFDITFETSLDEDDLKECEFSITVNWKNHNKKIESNNI